MKLIGLIAVLALSPVNSSWAAEDRQLAEELVRLMKVQEIYEQATPQMNAMLSNLLNSMEVPEDIRSEFMAFHEGQMERISEATSWPKVKDKYIDIYFDLFDTQELEGMIEFYSSPVGRSVIDKTPRLNARMMYLSQEQVMEMLPQIQADTQRFLEQLSEE